MVIPMSPEAGQELPDVSRRLRGRIPLRRSVQDTVTWIRKFRKASFFASLRTNIGDPLVGVCPRVLVGTPHGGARKCRPRQPECFTLCTEPCWRCFGMLNTEIAKAESSASRLSIKRFFSRENASPLEKTLPISRKRFPSRENASSLEKTQQAESSASRLSPHTISKPRC